MKGKFVVVGFCMVGGRIDRPVPVARSSRPQCLSQTSPSIPVVRNPWHGSPEAPAQTTVLPRNPPGSESGRNGAKLSIYPKIELQAGRGVPAEPRFTVYCFIRVR